MSRRTTARRLGACAVLVGAIGLGGLALTGSAAADPPVQTGWWNTAGGGGQAAPSPTTPEGGLHIAVAPGEVLAFGALLYTMPVDATATLELSITNAQGTPALQACPTKSVAWKAGDDQSADSAPDYDCSLHRLRGNVSADGKTVTFLLDSGVEVVPGMLSLAIVPIQTKEVPAVGGDVPVDTTQPFSVDIDKPNASSLTITGGTSVTPAGPTDSGTSTSTGNSGATTGHSGGGGPSGGAPSTVGSGGGGSVPVPPDLGSQTTTQSSTDSGTAPVVAPSNAPAPSTAPAAASAPTSDNRAHNAALAMLILIGLGIAAMSNGQLSRTPRLLGGGRHAASRAAPVAAAAAAPAALFGVRGLGRFNRPRDTPPRPLI